MNGNDKINLALSVPDPKISAVGVKGSEGGVCVSVTRQILAVVRHNDVVAECAQFVFEFIRNREINIVFLVCNAVQAAERTGIGKAVTCVDADCGSIG